MVSKIPYTWSRVGGNVLNHSFVGGDISFLPDNSASGLGKVKGIVSFFSPYLV